MPTKAKQTKKSSVKKPARSGKKSTKKKLPLAKRKPVEKLHDAREIVRERRYEVRNLVNQMMFASVASAVQQALPAGYNFKAEASALLIDVSANGCSLVFMKSHPISAKLSIGMRYVVQVPATQPRLATVRWLKPLDSHLINVGVQFD